MKKILLILIMVNSLFAQNLLVDIDKKMAPGSSESYKKLINTTIENIKQQS